jgi:hypothetical protein
VPPRDGPEQDGGDIHQEKRHAGAPQGIACHAADERNCTEQGQDPENKEDNLETAHRDGPERPRVATNGD